MPTHAETEAFWHDYSRLTRQQKDAFWTAVGKFVSDLKRGHFRKGLRVKRVQGVPGIFELTWAQDGRATFQFGMEQIHGEPHIIWRRVGTHSILEQP